MISASVDTTKLKNDDDRDYEVIFTCPPQSLEQRLLFQGRSRLQSPYSPSPSPNAPDDNVMFMVMSPCDNLTPICPSPPMTMTMTKTKTKTETSKNKSWFPLHVDKDRDNDKDNLISPPSVQALQCRRFRPFCPHPGSSSGSAVSTL